MTLDPHQIHTATDLRHTLQQLINSGAWDHTALAPEPGSAPRR
jgi:hypothetical protein